VGRYKCIVTSGDEVMTQEFIVSETGGVMMAKCMQPESTTGRKGGMSVQPGDSSIQQTVMMHMSESEVLAVKSNVANNEVLKEMTILEEVGQGNFGQVFKAIWRGTIVAAKEVRISGNQKIIENELSVYRSLNHPNLLSLLGTVTKPFSITLITNFVKGKTLHSLVFDSEKQLSRQEKIFAAGNCAKHLFSCTQQSHLLLTWMLNRKMFWLQTTHFRCIWEILGLER
jgi:serine/threonine protein kinase